MFLIVNYYICLKAKSMLNPIPLQDCLAGLVGFRDSLDQALPEIKDSLTESESGLYVNDQHTLVSIENIYAVIEQTGTITLPSAWSDVTAYTVGQKVSSATTIYTALQDGTNHLVTDTAYWQNEGNPLSLYLQQKYNQGVIKLANAVFQEKNLNQNAKSILPETMLYDNGGNIKNTIAKSGRFVGFKIRLNDLDLGMIIRKIGLQFTEVQTNLPIYLYNSSQDTYVKQWLVTTTQAYSFQWEVLTKEVISFLTDDTNAGSQYSLGYYEDDIAGLAINNEYSFGVNFCGSCNPYNAQLRQKWSKYLQLQPFVVLAANLPGDRTMWNSDNEAIIDGCNFGLNILASVFCDSTDFFCRNKDGLINALALQIAVSIIEDMAFSGRDNQKQAKLVSMANFALGSNRDINTPGLYKDLKNAIMAVDFNYGNVNSDCLPCSDIWRNDVSMGSIY